jgi:hypothetical protein
MERSAALTGKRPTRALGGEKCSEDINEVTNNLDMLDLTSIIAYYNNVQQSGNVCETCK